MELIDQKDFFFGLNPSDDGLFLVRGVKDSRDLSKDEVNDYAFGMKECGVPPNDVQNHIKSKFPNLNLFPRIFYEIRGKDIYWICIEKWISSEQVILTVGRNSKKYGISEKTIQIKKDGVWVLEKIISFTAE